MVIRSYIEKNNTLILDSETNTGNNPIAELYYGGSDTTEDYSRHLLYFDIVNLQQQYNDGKLGDLSKVRHTLKMCNSSYFDQNLQAQKLLDGKQRTSSFDLILFKVKQDWDEGTGYDYQRVISTESDNNITFVQTASNWYYATTNTPWTGTTTCVYTGLSGNTCDGLTGYTQQISGGVYDGNPSGITITTQHFDKGNENIEMDMTTEVNNLITGGTTNYGYGVAFDYTLENTITAPSQYVGFFTRHTQTYYEPFLETIYDNPIKDDRKNFYKNKLNRIYLYSNVGGEPKNLDSNPVVTIYDNNGNVFSSITETIQATEGIYYAEVFVPETAADGVLYFDEWSDLVVDGISVSNVELDFEVKSDTEYYQIGNNESLPVDYAMSISGVKRDEKIKRGDVRKIMVSARIPYTINESKVIDNLQYRLWVREGNTQVNVIEWQDVNIAYLKNYFLLDTSWMIPNRYYIDIKLTSNQEVKTYTDQMQFEIVNQVDELH
jgi:hypothetical protein